MWHGVPFACQRRPQPPPPPRRKKELFFFELVTEVPTNVCERSQSRSRVSYRIWVKARVPPVRVLGEGGGRKEGVLRLAPPYVPVERVRTPSRTFQENRTKRCRAVLTRAHTAGRSPRGPSGMRAHRYPQPHPLCPATGCTTRQSVVMGSKNAHVHERVPLSHYRQLTSARQLRGRIEWQFRSTARRSGKRQGAPQRRKKRGKPVTIHSVVLWAATDGGWAVVPGVP